MELWSFPKHPGNIVEKSIILLTLHYLSFTLMKGRISQFFLNYIKFGGWGILIYFFL